MSGDSGRFSSPARQVPPPSVDTSTLEIPRSPAKATPATVVGPETDEPSRGTSILDPVFTMAFFDHPRCSQYPRYGESTTSIPVSHLGFFIPYVPTERTLAGNPCSRGSTRPFIPTAISVLSSMAWATERLSE